MFPASWFGPPISEHPGLFRGWPGALDRQLSAPVLARWGNRGSSPRQGATGNKALAMRASPDARTGPTMSQAGNWVESDGAYGRDSPERRELVRLDHSAIDAHAEKTQRTSRTGTTH